MNAVKNNAWKIIGIAIVVVGLYSTFVRFTQGLKGSTNLSDAFPWGMWIGFDILCGVGLAAGGFTICAAVYIFNLEKYHPLVRPSVLTAFLGYVLVIFGLMYDLGKPYNIWHAIIMWNPRSVMFEVAWCVMLYTTVLFLEFSPVIFEGLKWQRLQKIMKAVTIPLIIIGVLLSTLHQSSLGSLFLIIPTKMHPLWYSSYLPLFFYLSAIATGLSMVIFESYLSARAFNKGLEMHLLSKVAFASVVVLLLNLALRIADLLWNNKLEYLITFNEASAWFYAEIIIGSVIPAFILLSKENRNSRSMLYFSAVLIIAGFLFNRLNVSITSITTQTGVQYFPSFYEISVTLMLVVVGMYAFKLAVKYLPVFTEHEMAHK